MGVRVIGGGDGACIYDSVTMWAFGPIFEDAEQAEEFLQWLPRQPDPRLYTDRELSGKYSDFLQYLEDKQKEEANDDAD